VRLDGLDCAWLMQWPGEIAQGNGRSQSIIDERANPAQREALGKILRGESTAPGATHFYVFASTMREVLDTIYAPIEVEIDVAKRTARVHAPDLLESLAFYERLGFTQVTAGEAWPYPYAAVSDGRLSIGLHGRELPQTPLLAFVLPDLFHRLDALEARGLAILDRRLGHDVFNEASLEIAGQRIRLLEARTHSPAPRAPGETSRLGWFEEYALPVADVKRAAASWEMLGFVQAEEGEAPYPHVGLTSDSLNVALVRAGFLARPTLLFADAEMPERITRLANARVEPASRLPASLDRTRNALVVAPEGTELLLTTSE
jgi:hypothetical protein